VTSFVRRARRWTLPLALGLSDGILNALILASAALLHDGNGLTIMFAMKVGCVALVTAIFTMFVAEYSELRARLSRATRQLNLSASGHLASTNLGRRVVLEAAEAAIIASVSSFAGATIPLAIAGTFPSAPWIGFVVAIALLGLLGAALAASFDGRLPRWIIGLTLAGVAVAAIGSRLDIT
jgi:VIT1/CCC1 family predicted Fe2+/Mn2+ transporter